jgi:membrane associated rhomboid family serine protease
MRSAPSWKEFPKYPVIAGISIFAIGTTVAWWSKVDISPLFETAMIRRGQFWRLVANILPHTDILHLAFNIYWFWVFGTLVEEVFGHLKTAILILLLALGSGSMEFALADGGVGLSGVGYGLFGLLWFLSSRDDRLRSAVDQRTVQLFVGWFVFCIATTILKIFPVANIAHAAGAVLGLLVGAAIAVPHRRFAAVLAIAVIIGFGLWGSTLGRPRINLSPRAGYEEGTWGYDALVAGRNDEAVHWLGDATIYRPKLPVYWYDLGIAYQRLGNMRAALPAYQRAHELEPNNTEYSEAINGLK